MVAEVVTADAAAETEVDAAVETVVEIEVDAVAAMADEVAAIEIGAETAVVAMVAIEDLVQSKHPLNLENQTANPVLPKCLQRSLSAEAKKT